MNGLRRKLIAAIWLGAPAAALALAGIAIQSQRSTQQAIEDQRGALADLQDRLAHLPEPQPEAAPRASLLQNYADVAGTLRDIEAMGTAANAGIRSAQAEAAVVPGAQAFHVVGAAAPRDVCALLAAMETGARLMVLQSGKVEAGEEGQVRYDFVLSTFHRTEAGR